MTKIDDPSTQFVDAEINEHQAALVRQMVAVCAIIGALLILMAVR
jgi:hypothetical protein